MAGFEGRSIEPGGGGRSSSVAPIPAAVGEQQLADHSQKTALFRFMRQQKELHRHVQLGLDHNRIRQQSCINLDQVRSQRVDLAQKRVLGHSHGQHERALAGLVDVTTLNLNSGSASIPLPRISLPLSRQLDCHASNNGHMASDRYWQASSCLSPQQDLEASIDGTIFIEREKLLGQLSDQYGQYGVDRDEKEQKKKNKIKANSGAGSDKETSRRVCRYCEREFPSGRALGGHMRVHGAFFSDGSTQTSTMLKPVSSSSSKGPALGLISSSYNTLQKTPTSCTNAFPEQLLWLPGTAGFHDQLHSNRFAALQPAPGSRPSTNLSSSMKKSTEADEEDHEEVLSDGDVDNCKAVADCIRSMPLNKDQYLGAARSLNELSSNEQGIDGLLSLGSKVLSDVSKANSVHKLRRNPRVPQLDHIRLHDLPPTMSDFLRKAEPPSPESARPCSECGKVFWSWKALFGHMRCHPERDWRGIQRPDGGFELEKQAGAVMKRSPTEQSFSDKSKLKVETDVENKAGGANGKPEKAMISALDVEMARHPSHTEDRKANRKETGGEEAGCCVKEGPNSSMKREVEEAPKLVAGNMKEEQAASGEAAEEAKSPKGGEIAVSDLKQEGYDNMAMMESSGEKERSGKRGRDSAFREITDDNNPSSWPTRRRSKRRRARNSHGLQPNFNPEPGLTSETASDQELKGKASLLRDQEDLDMANCLVLLSGAGAGNRIDAAEKSVESTEESANSESGRMHEASEDCSVLQEADSDDDACDHQHCEDQHMIENNNARGAGDPVTVLSASSTVAKYECSTCKRCFNSHQALGGHRASHRKMKGCFTKAVLSEEAHENGREIIGESKTISSHRSWAHQIISSQRATSIQEQQLEVSTLPYKEKLLSKRKIKGHQCSICHRIFPSGQALGGHKRCHWTGEKIADTASVASSSNKQPSMQEKHDLGNRSTAEQPRKIEDSFDLNLPAPMEDEDEVCFNTHETPGYSRQMDVINGASTLSGEQILGPFVGYPAMRSNASSICGKRVAQADVLRSNGDGSWIHPSRDVEARCRLDGSSKVWNQEWNNAVASQVPCMYTLQPL